MRRLICGALTAALAISLLVPSASAASFSDIQGHWGESAIEQVTDWGLFSGTGNQQFSPNLSMTRGMFVTVMESTAKLLGLHQAPAGDIPFVDVSADAWYAQAVNWAVENGITGGVGNNRFDPDAPVTREQMCVMMTRFLDLCTDADLGATTEEIVFLDRESISAYAVESVRTCVALGLIAGIPTDGGVEFQPRSTATRAAVAVVLEHLVNVIRQQPGGGEEIPPETEAPTEEEKADEAKVAEYLQIIVDNHSSEGYKPGTDQEVKDCMEILIGCIEDALAQRQKGQFLNRAYIRERYAGQIDQLRIKYDQLTEDQLNQINNLIVRLADTEQIYFVMDYFGVSLGT